MVFLYHNQPQKSVYQLEAYSKGGSKGLPVCFRQNKQTKYRKTQYAIRNNPEKQG